MLTHYLSGPHGDAGACRGSAGHSDSGARLSDDRTPKLGRRGMDMLRVKGTQRQSAGGARRKRVDGLGPCRIPGEKKTCTVVRCSCQTFLVIDGSMATQASVLIESRSAYRQNSGRRKSR